MKIICTIKDVQNNVNVSKSKAQRMISQCRDALGKKHGQLLFLEDFLKYWELN